MARNKEKQLGRLNRVHLQKQHDEEKLKNPPRPRLDTLLTVPEIVQWLPSIKKDIDFFLKQSQVTCYPERKVAEFADSITRLRKEYLAFVRKVWELQPVGEAAVPGVDRKYTKRCKISQSDNGRYSKGDNSDNGDVFARVELPVLENDEICRSFYGYQTQTEQCIQAEANEMDAPLEFSQSGIHGEDRQTPESVKTDRDNNLLLGLKSSCSNDSSGSTSATHPPATLVSHDYDAFSDDDV